MSKIFRLHKGANETIANWQKITGHLSTDQINSISDPSGSTAHTQITSIPSPFARMDLIRTAFEIVVATKKLDDSTIYHRMVSDCLDIAEIFFNIEALQEKIEVIQFSTGIHVNAGKLDIDETSDLGKMLASSNPKHQLLGETLKMFFFQDRAAFNFAEFGHCYLLNYKSGPGRLNVIGGTSPSTLFFSTANDLSFVDISFGNNQVFDTHFTPLFKRGAAFIKYMFALEKGFSAFSEKFKFVKEYLDLNYTVLDQQLKNEVAALDASAYDKYDLLPVVAEGNNAEILKVPLRVKSYGAVTTAEDNDFMLVPDKGKVVSGPVPLALPKEAFNDPLRYGGRVWKSSDTEGVPYTDARPLAKRTLPNLNHVQYPYLTISDLLQPYLIRLPYAIDSKRFFDGNYEVRQGEKDHSYVLPLKKEYFDYFTVEGLKGQVSDGKKRMELVQMPLGVKVILRLPIKSGKYIQFSRLYNFNSLQDAILPADPDQNIGVVVDNQFTLAVYPFIRVAGNADTHYRVMLVDRDVSTQTKGNSYALTYFAEKSPLESVEPLARKQRSSKTGSPGVTTSYDVLEKNFDLVEVTNHTASGMLVPLFEPLPAGSLAFKFAIDFGTSNTHIEYMDKRGNKTQPFEITDKDVQVATLHMPTEATESHLKSAKLGFGADKLLLIIQEEFIPFQIHEGIQYKFPQRTVINDNGQFNAHDSNFALADFNIPFWYLKEDHKLNSEITPDLKWAEFTNDKRLERRTVAFLKQLMMMIRNKVLLDGGDLAATEIVWFYPSSMPIHRRLFFANAWEKYYHRYFPGATKLYSMSESFAPFYHYYHKESVRPHDRPAVNIDIGGGTTDIVIYHSELPIALTSFRFAANAIFGDGYGGTWAANGFIQHFEAKIIEALSRIPSGGSLKGIYDNIKSKNTKSGELVEFFFSLEENKAIKDNRLPLSFSKLLAEGTAFKLVFIFFYAAIIYHIARLMKAKAEEKGTDFEIPEFITFSGNGSKVIRLASGGNDLSSLQAYTKVIFGEVYGIEQVPDIDFRLTENPKEITCKGGLECPDPTAFKKLEDEITVILTGVDATQTVPPASLSYVDLQKDEVIAAVVGEVNAFIDLFFRLSEKFDYYKHFGIDENNFEEYRQVLKSRTKSDLIDGIRQKLNEREEKVNVTRNISETPFFYPLIGAINRLAAAIEKKNS